MLSNFIISVFLDEEKQNEEGIREMKKISCIILCIILLNTAVISASLPVIANSKSNSNNINFVPSGIYRNDNTWLYVIGDYENIYIFSKKQLQNAHKNKKFREVEIPTSRGFIIPLDEALKLLIIKSFGY